MENAGMEIAGFVKCPECNQLTPVTLAELESAARNPLIECVTPGCLTFGERTAIHIENNWVEATNAA